MVAVFAPVSCNRVSSTCSWLASAIYCETLSETWLAGTRLSSKKEGKGGWEGEEGERNERKKEQGTICTEAECVCDQ